MIVLDRWSYSRLGCYQRCPAQFYFRYVERCPSEETSAALLLGTAVHDAITLHHVHRFRGAPLPPAAIRENVRGQITALLTHPEAPIAFPQAHPDAKSTMEMAVRLLDEYLSHVSNGEIVAVEQELEAPIGSAPLVTGMTLVGVIDRIERRPDGITTAVEVKTAAKAWSERDVEFSDQITTYAYLLRQAGYEQVPFRIEILTKTKTPRLQIVETTRSAQQMERLVTKFFAVERAIEAGAFPTHEGLACATCSYRRRCAASPP